MAMSLFMSTSVSAGLHNLAIFKTSLISLLPVFQTDEAICIMVFSGNFLIIELMHRSIALITSKCKYGL